MFGEKPRQFAARVLKRYAGETKFLEELLGQELAKVNFAPADRALVKELTFGLLRWESTLDWLIEQKTQRRPQKLDIRILLRMGLYQIFWLERIPNHAAVHETVEIAKRSGFIPQAKFINAILRSYLREREETARKLAALKTENPALGYSHPAWLCERWRRRWGEEALRKLLEWNNSPPPTYARLNTLKTDAQQLTKQWQEEEVQFVPRQWDWVGPDLIFELQAHPPLTTLPSFQQGFFYVQDPSTVLSVVALDPKPGEQVLDMCAAPGGKTTLIAQLMDNQGLVVAQDPHLARRDLVRENCLRLGVINVCLSHPQVTRPSGMPKAYDRVLVDAPCSNTGVMRRRVDLRWRIRPEEIQRLRETQLDLLHQAARQLKPGGTLVYSTCSLEPEENEDVSKDFLSRHREFGLDYERSLLPFVDGVDGAYIARFRRMIRQA